MTRSDRTLFIKNTCWAHFIITRITPLKQFIYDCEQLYLGLTVCASNLPISCKGLCRSLVNHDFNHAQKYVFISAIRYINWNSCGLLAISPSHQSSPPSRLGSSTHCDSIWRPSPSEVCFGSTINCQDLWVSWKEMWMYTSFARNGGRTSLGHASIVLIGSSCHLMSTSRSRRQSFLNCYDKMLAVPPPRVIGMPVVQTFLMDESGWIGMSDGWSHSMVRKLSRDLGVSRLWTQL